MKTEVRTAEALGRHRSCCSDNWSLVAGPGSPSPKPKGNHSPQLGEGALRAYPHPTVFLGAVGSSRSRTLGCGTVWCGPRGGACPDPPAPMSPDPPAQQWWGRGVDGGEEEELQARTVCPWQVDNRAPGPVRVSGTQPRPGQDPSLAGQADPRPRGWLGCPTVRGGARARAS